MHSNRPQTNQTVYHIEQGLIYLSGHNMYFMHPLSKLIFNSGREIDDALLFYKSSLANNIYYKGVLTEVSPYILEMCEVPSTVLDRLDSRDYTIAMGALLTLVNHLCREISNKGETAMTTTNNSLKTKFRNASKDPKLQMIIETLNERYTTMHEEARAEISTAIDKAITSGPKGSDYLKMIDYLTMCAKLSFGTELTDDESDFDTVMERLNKSHFGMDDAKERIMEFLAVSQLKENADGPKFVMVGGAGTGKTSFANALGVALGRKVQRIALGGVNDTAILRGHGRTYVGSQAGRIMDAMAKCKVDNPIIILDEVDKMGGVGGAESVLLEVLDPEQNEGFVDTYLNFPYDLSKVIFVATANYEEMIDAPLMDRMEYIPTKGYTVQEKLKIAMDYVVPRKLEKLGLKKENIKITKATIQFLIDGYTREAGVRRMEQAIEKLMRGTVRDILKDRTKTVSLTKAVLKKRLGEPFFKEEDAPDHSIPGTCTGLAYTGVGGVTASMEVVYCSDLGMKMTGEAGSMLRNSLDVAMTNVQNNAAYIDADTSILEEVGLHAQLGDGATNTDGPSAGILFATSIASLLTGTPVKDKLAMTGEIRLNGRVTAIGGLDEKIPGGYRCGIREFIIPKENEKDLKDVPKDILKKVKVHCVENISEVLKIALDLDMEAGKEVIREEMIQAAQEDVVAY